jgi:hypothetical protein
MEKHGVEYTFQAESVKEKIKASNMELYGVEFNMQRQDVVEKVKTNNISKYGVSHPLKMESYKEKVKNTNIQKYGVKHAMQSKEIQEKSQKNGLRYKDYTTPSGQVWKVQGYEPHALDILTKEYEEEDIITSRKDVPRIQYTTPDNTLHYYFPDIWIKSINKLIEVKSSWTYKLHETINELKWNAATREGYQMECWIFDKKGNRTILCAATLNLNVTDCKEVQR